MMCPPAAVSHTIMTAGTVKTDACIELSKRLIKGIQKLESLGIDAELSSLPKFVVVGDQSHGKSSIIEAICGISLPRSAGTCTRCPFRITTTATRPGESWSCAIALSRRYVPERNGKWRDTQAAEPVYFTTVSDRNDLEHTLRLAQIAILNPQLDAATLLHVGPPTTAQGHSFSPNQIDLRISGSDLPELSMIDLPGSINVAPDESEQHLVGLIERLIKTYVKDEKALILLVASMDQDLETSTAFRFVGNCKALGRSMGVLTKPDLLTTGRFDHVHRILSGNVFKLGHAWHVTKCSTQEDLDRAVTHLGAREAERAFFERDPWSSDLADYGERFGIKNLQNAISHRLVAHIEDELPGIVDRVDSRMSEVSQQLDRMPAQPTNPSQTVIEEMQRLLSAIMENIKGDDEGAAFRTEYKGLLRRYRDRLQNARPQVLLGTPGYVKPVLSVDSDDETMSDAPTPSKRQKTSNGQPASSSTPSRFARSGGRRDHVKSDDDSAVTAGRAVFTLDQIHSALDQARDSDMPDQIHPKITKRFIRQANAPWPKLTAELLEFVQKSFGKVLGNCIADTLESRTGTELFTKVMDAVQKIVDDIWTEETNHIDHLVACEMHTPITYAGGINRISAEVRAKLQESRTAERVEEYYDTMEAEKKVKVPTGQKRKDKIHDLEFVTKSLGPDTYANEVTAMVSPLAYYDLASARLTDTVANHLEFGIMHAIETKLQVRLMLELRVTDQTYCAELLAEDPAREAERRRLIAEPEKLIKAVEELKGLPGLYCKEARKNGANE